MISIIWLGLGSSENNELIDQSLLVVYGVSYSLQAVIFGVPTDLAIGLGTYLVCALLAKSLNAVVLSAMRLT